MKGMLFLDENWRFSSIKKAAHPAVDTEKKSHIEIASRMALSFASKLFAFVLFVQFCTTQQKAQSSIIRCLTGYKDR